MRPFRIDVSDAILDDLKRRLASTRFTDQLDDAGWAYGTERSYLRELCAYWQSGFDWRKQEAALNRLPQFSTQIEGRQLHFVHARSPRPDALPLLISHGWPGSFFEFHKIIGPLTDPEAHGDGAAQAFHVICPSIPGYGFSDAPTARGFDVTAAARVFSTLMEQLGYSRYGAQGGDWGAVITQQLALAHPDRVCGIHLNMVVAAPDPKDPNPMAGVTAQEQQWLAEYQRFIKEETGYQRIQGTKPQTLAYALNDSPAGLAAWIVEKFHTWTDCDGDLERVLSKDELLTNITIYWVTQTIGSSIRLYYETMGLGRKQQAHARVEVPTACALFPRELMRPPRKWAEASYNVQRWTEFDAGGHFAALEQPAALTADIRAFFGSLGR